MRQRVKGVVLVPKHLVEGVIDLWNTIYAIHLYPCGQHNVWHRMACLKGDCFLYGWRLLQFCPHEPNPNIQTHDALAFF